MKVLLSSVFGPYGVDDAYGRKENVMELFHNQVTREQGLFSLRFHHHSFGLYLLAENLQAPVTVLDFPTESAFLAELEQGYDYVGISFITPNFRKAQAMAEQVRRQSPASKIVLGGHGTAIDGIEELIEHDHLCRGEGVRWLRRLLGEDPDRPLRHPALPSAFGGRVLGIPVETDAAVLIPGVGCPNCCRFCSTSHFFGERYTPFFATAEELFAICREIEGRLGLREFFVMDENFLKLPQRARQLARLNHEHGTYYRYGLFSSADTIAELGVEELVRLGVYWLWIGVESQQEIYDKNRDIDFRRLIRRLRDHGIIVLASAILFLEQHDRQTIWDDIRFVTSLQPDFTQFMQLGPLPTTRLYRDYAARGLLRTDMLYEEWHGQHQIWFHHPHFTAEESSRYLGDAFRHEYDTLGPSLLRMCDTTLRGYRTLAAHAGDPVMVRRRQQLASIAAGLRPLLPVLRRRAHTRQARQLADDLIRAYRQELGPMSLGQRLRSIAAQLLAARQARRLARGVAMPQPATLRTCYQMAGARARPTRRPQVLGPRLR